MIHKFSVELGGGEQELSVEKLDGNRVRVVRGANAIIYDAVRVAANGRASTWSLLPEGGGRAALIDVDGGGSDLNVTVDNRTVPLKLLPARAKLAGLAAAPAKTGPQSVQSPMPGKVVKILCAPGDDVKAGQGVIVVEAMKMENELKAARDGKVKSVSVKEGQPVEAGQTLIAFE
jgi:acetyl/propionyl-CoA carboxylase alpha subunit